MWVSTGLVIPRQCHRHDLFYAISFHKVKKAKEEEER